MWRSLHEPFSLARTSWFSRPVLCADSFLAETDLHAPCSAGFALSGISVLWPHVGLDCWEQRNSFLPTVPSHDTQCHPGQGSLFIHPCYLLQREQYGSGSPRDLCPALKRNFVIIHRQELFICLVMKDGGVLSYTAEAGSGSYYCKFWQATHFS